jgi:amidase
VAAAGAFGCRRQQAPAPSATLAPDTFEFEEATVADLQDAMSSGRLTARALVETYSGRIQRLDRAGPALRTVIEMNPDAAAIADQLDRERQEGRLRGPLHGIPVLLKDNIDTGDRMTTTAGSLALTGSIAARDSTVAKQLRDAGAILFGKANLSEWANIRSAHSSSGWSARGGQCRNPYVLDRNPCGSSSGSAVAVSANLTAVAVGTETDGSIVCPASANGVVGIKPTVGLVSRAGIIPISHSQDTAGPIARTVRDAATLLTIMASVDSRDAATQTSSRQAVDYVARLDVAGLKGARIGVARSFFTFAKDVTAVFDAALDAMREAGATLVDPVTLPLPLDLEAVELEVLLTEFKAGLNDYLAGVNAAITVRSLADVIRFNDENRDREMPFFGQDLFLRAQDAKPLTDVTYRSNLQKIQRAAGESGIDSVMNDQRLDAIVAPSGGPAWTTDHVNGDHFEGGSSSPAAIAGYPSVSVPAGYVSELPVGLSFFGRAWSEATLLRVAYAFEQTTKQRRPPKFVPTIEA